MESIIGKYIMARRMKPCAMSFPRIVLDNCKNLITKTGKNIFCHLVDTTSLSRKEAPVHTKNVCFSRYCCDIRTGALVSVVSDNINNVKPDPLYSIISPLVISHREEPAWPFEKCIVRVRGRMLSSKFTGSAWGLPALTGLAFWTLEPAEQPCYPFRYFSEYSIPEALW